MTTSSGRKAMPSHIVLSMWWLWMSRVLTGSVRAAAEAWPSMLFFLSAPGVVGWVIVPLAQCPGYQAW